MQSHLMFIFKFFNLILYGDYYKTNFTIQGSTLTGCSMFRSVVSDLT